tara:strand:+ start:2570 stop:3130 length:561 start_codon:yes stop_codon:yes gene_type:complete
MGNVFIIHGTEGNPEGNWFPWIKGELEKLGHIVFVPKFPTPEGQSLNSWLDTFENYINKINEDTVFVAHSLGPAFVLNVLERIDKKVKACFFVSGFISLLGNEHYDNLNRSFIDKEFDWKKIKKNCNKFIVINSKDDPYVPFEEGKKLADRLNAEFIALDKAGHINTEFGFDKFEMLLEEIKKELN